jgi:DNA-directed RNA polymerase specialized sigma subunit
MSDINNERFIEQVIERLREELGREPSEREVQDAMEGVFRRS